MEVPHEIVHTREIPTTENEVLLRFDNDLAAEAFDAWWTLKGSEAFANWCAKKEWCSEIVSLV